MNQNNPIDPTAVNKANKELNTSLRTIGDIRDEYNDVLRDLRKAQDAIKKLHLGGSIKTTKLREFDQKLKDVHGRMEKCLERVVQTNGGLEVQRRAYQQLSKEAAKLTDQIEEYKYGMEDATKLMKEGNWSGMFKKAGVQIGSSSNKMLAGVGSALKGVGGMLGSVSKMFSGGWAGVLVSMVGAADEFRKKANKQFAMVRGPDIMTTDIKGQFDSFNNQIYSTGQNIKVGLNADQVREFMNSLSQAGVNITALNKGLMTYRDVVTMAAKASRVLGVDVTYAGNMMGKMVTDFRMDLDKTDEAFTQIAFDAKKSGLSTDRFWNTIQNASASLALYGVALGTTSKIMKRFTEDQIGGADDAAAATENMMDVFKSGSIENSAALIDFAKIGGANVSKMFENIRDSLDQEISDITVQIRGLEGKKGKKPEDVEAIKKLRKDLIAKQSQSNRYQSMIGKNAVVQATEMGALAKDAPEMLISAVKGIVGVKDISKISGENMIVAIKALEKQGVHEKTVRMLVGEAQTTAGLLDILGKNFEGGFDKMDQTIRSKIGDQLENWGSKSVDEQIRSSNNIASILYESKAFNETDSETLAQIARDDDTTRELLKNILKNPDDKKSLDTLKATLKSSRLTDKMTQKRFSDQEMATGDMAKNAENTFKEIVNQTLSYQEMLDIAKNEIQWRASNLGLLKGLNTGVSSILGWLTKGTGYQTEAQKGAELAIKAAAQQNDTLKGILNSSKDGKLNSAVQAEMMRKSLAEIQRLTPEVQGLERAMAAGDLKGTLDDITKTIADKTKSGVKADDPGMRALIKEKSVLEQTLSANKDIVSQLEALKKQDEKGMTNEQKLDKRGKISKLQQELKDKLVEGNKKQLDDNKKSLQQFTDTVKELTTLNETNDKIKNIQELMLKADPEAMANIADQIQSQLDEGKTLDEALQNVGASADQAVAAFEAKIKRDEPIFKGTAKSTESLKKFKALQAMPEEERRRSEERKAAILERNMGKKDVREVVSPGMVNLSKGDIAVDKKSLAQVIGGPRGAVIPDIMREAPAVKAAAAGGGGTGKTIQINVTATEKDLAQKIANEVRAVIYKNQLN